MRVKREICNWSIRPAIGEILETFIEGGMYIQGEPLAQLKVAGLRRDSNGWVGYGLLRPTSDCNAASSSEYNDSPTSPFHIINLTAGYACTFAVPVVPLLRDKSVVQSANIACYCSAYLRQPYLSSKKIPSR